MSGAVAANPATGRNLSPLLFFAALIVLLLCAVLAVVVRSHRSRVPRAVLRAADAEPAAVLAAASVGEVAPAATAQAAPVLDAEPLIADQLEKCEIRVWRGYSTWLFYAAVERDGAEYALHESKPFRSAGNGIPSQTPAALAAHEGLLIQLAQNAWEPEQSQTGAWYQTRLSRDTSAALPQPLTG